MKRTREHVSDIATYLPRTDGRARASEADVRNIRRGS